MPLRDRPALIDALIDAACAAGDIVWRYHVHGCAVVSKADDSPVTAADREAEAVILAALAAAAPGVPVVAEEEAAAGRVPAVDGAFFLVDPLDGTKEFVARGRDFTVNIGLVEQGAPTLGIIYAPAHDALYWGDVGAGAWRAERRPGAAPGVAEPIAVRAQHRPPCAVASRSHAAPPTRAWLDANHVTSCVSVGSSLKFALVATGEADVYPRCGPTMEWDTCAGDAILRAAGGRTLAPDGAPFRYGKPGFRNTAFVATGGWDAPPIGPYCA